MCRTRRLKPFLDSLVAHYERPAFIARDPIAVCHRFDDPRDQEVIGLYAATLAWGQRRTILNKLDELCDRMEQRPYSFVWDFGRSRDVTRLDGFRHRTFTSVDAVWFTACLSRLLHQYKTVEAIFAAGHALGALDTGPAIHDFSERMMNALAGTPPRMQKHLARPLRGSAAKRLCLYLRWMVRPGPVDLGLWTSIGPHQLVLPLDVHSGRQARALGVLTRNSNDWQAAQELTLACRDLCQEDPARYDYAFFGLGISGELPLHLTPPPAANRA